MLDRPDDERDLLPSARDLFTGSGEAILVHDAADGTVLDGNPAAERMYGHDAAALRGTPIGELVVGDNRDLDVSTLVDEDRTVHWHVEGPDGDQRLLDVSVRRAESGDTILSFARDVTGGKTRTAAVEQPFKQLQEIVSRRDIEFDEKIDRLLELGCAWLDLSVGYMTRIGRSTQTVDSAVGTHEDIQPGETAPLSETYCQHTLAAADSGTPIHSIESAAEAGILESEEYDRFGLSCYVGGEITVDGETYGTVCFADTEPRDRPFSGREQTFVDLLTQWVGLTIERREQAAQIQAEHELTATILESSPTGIVVFSADGEVRLANDRANDLLGDGASLAGARELPVSLCDDAGSPVPDAELPRQRVERGETLQNEQYRLGESQFVSVSGRPLATADGGVVLTVDDVTDQRRHTDAMQALSDTLASTTGDFDAQLRDLLEVGRRQLGLANGHLTEIDGDRHELIASEGLPELLEPGAVSELGATFCQSVVEEDEMCTVTEASIELSDTTAHEAWGLETYIGTAVRVDGEMYGTICFVDETPRSRPFHPWERAFVQTLGRWVETQIQQRRNAAERDRDRALLEGVFNSQRTQVGITDTDGLVVDANAAAVSFVDSDPEAIVGTPVWETPWFAEEPARSRCEAGVERALDGEMTDFEVTYDAESGEQTIFNVNIRPVLDDGEVIYVVVEGHDITELREREQELQRRQQHIDTILNNVPMVLFAVDESGAFIDSRGRGLASFGLEEGELVGQSLYEEYDAFPEVIEDYERARDGEAVESVRTIGETVFRSWYRPVDVDGESHVIGIAVDITEQQRQKERVAAVNEAAEQLMYAHSPNAVAETVVDIVGDLISYPLAGVWVPEDGTESLVPVAATDTVLDAMGADSPEEALPAIEPGSFEMTVWEDGETRVIEDYSETEGGIGQDTPIKTVVMVPLGEYGHFHVGSTAKQRPSDTELDLIGILARNAEAALVSSTREAELEAYKDELERSNEALQEFAYIASHDLQEPLRMVSSYVDLLESEYGDELGAEASEYMDFAVDGAKRMQNMIDALLEYSRVETKGQAFEPVETAAVVDRTLDALQLRIDETNATISVGSLPTVRGDPNQLGQLFQNLLENALEYTSDSGVDPEIRIDAEVTGETATVTVSDNGPGIPEGMAEDIFEIFNRGGSHDTDGTGIGLAVCRRIVRRHDGEIRAVESEGGGATFEFTLPVPGEVTADE